MNRYVNLYPLLALNLLLAGCGDPPDFYASVESVRSPLVATFMSYMTPDEASKRLGPGNPAWEVVEDSKLPAGDKRPPFDSYTVSVAGFEHLAQVGELHLHFFNRRLESTWFFPRDYQAFLAALTAHGIDLRGSAEVSVAPFTRIWTGKDYKGKMYVVWEDTRLRSQGRRWIERYA